MVPKIAISNQKGGVGKTTTAINLSTELALLDYKVLLIDFDPQGSASSGVGEAVSQAEGDLFDFFFGKVKFSEIIKETKIRNLFLAPASKDLVGVEIEVGKIPGRELILKTGLKEIESEFDFIIIDCPPSSGLLTLNALGAANRLIIPLQAEYYALEGISALTNTVNFVRETFNPSLEILGVLITMFDPRTNLSTQVANEVKSFFGEKVFETYIPRSVRIAESPSHGLPISLYDRQSSGAKAYAATCVEVLDRLGLLREKAGNE
jgi:chromosome partitioning protein